jgi:galactonate dehydratase
MRIERIETLLMQAQPPGVTAWAGASALASSRNWLFVEVTTDTGITGVGEGSGWPRVVATAVEDLAHVLIGEDPFDIERLWQKMYVAMMGHGQTGVVGGGALSALDMALWDIKGKALGTPVWNLLGGRVRDTIPYYSHAQTPDEAKALVERGIRAVKVGGIVGVVERARAVREAIGPECDLMIDLHGPPWLTAADVISLKRDLESLDLLFLEEPVAPEDTRGLRRIREHLDVPLAAGERVATLWGNATLLDEGLVDVLQPDPGRIGGISQLRKLAAAAESRFVSLAPHAGSLGPVAEYAAVHVLASIPNALMLERMEPDWEGRARVALPPLGVENGVIHVPDAPGLGVTLDHDFIRAHPSVRNTAIATGGWRRGTEREYVYVQPQRGRHTRDRKRPTA